MRLNSPRAEREGCMASERVNAAAPESALPNFATISSTTVQNAEKRTRESPDTWVTYDSFVNLVPITAYAVDGGRVFLLNIR